MITALTITILFLALAVVGFVPTFAHAEEKWVTRLRNEKQITAELEDQLKLSKEIEGAEEEILSDLEKRAELQAELASSTASQRKLVTEMLHDKKGTKEIIESELVALQKSLENLEEQGKLSAAEQIAMKTKIGALKEIKEMETHELETLKGDLDLIVKINKELKKRLGHTEKIKGGVSSIANMLGLASDFQETMLGQTFEMLKNYKGWRDYVKAFGQQLKASFGFMNVLSGIGTHFIENLIKMVWELDNAQSAFNRATGAAGRYDDMIAQQYGTFLKYNISAEKHSETLQALIEQNTQFTLLSDKQQRSMTTLATKLSLVGVGTAEAAQQFEGMTRVLGIGVDDVENMSMEMMGLSRDLGILPRQLTADFVKAMPRLAMFGEGGVRQFKALEKQAKATGLSVDELTGSFGDQLDTFEGSAKAAGQLNALLGGPYLNSVKLLGMNQVERLKYMRQGIRMSGLNLKALANENSAFSRQKLMALASASGIKSVDKFLKAMGVTATETGKKIEDKDKKQAMAQKDLTKAIKSGVSVMDELRGMLKSIIEELGGPNKLLSYLRQAKEWVLGVKDSFGSWHSVLAVLVIPAVISVGSRIQWLFPILKTLGIAVASAFGGFAKAAGWIGLAIAAFYGFKELTKEMGPWPGMLFAVAAAIAAIAVASTFGAAGFSIATGMLAIGAAAGIGTYVGESGKKAPAARRRSTPPARQKAATLTLAARSQVAREEVDALAAPASAAGGVVNEIIIQLDGNVLGRYVEDYIKKQRRLAIRD